VLVLSLNGWRCPLTLVAARYTHDRRDNVDIYLPEWLARHNKLLFGALYLAGILFTLTRWVYASIVDLARRAVVADVQQYACLGWVIATVLVRPEAVQRRRS
jgi:polyferredoxin